MSYTLKTHPDTPYGTYPPYPEGPAVVQNNGWNTSCESGAHIDGAKVSAFRVVCEKPWTTERHALDGRIFPDQEAAQRAKYEAGLIAYMVYDDSEWADKGSDVEEIVELLKPTHAKPKGRSEEVTEAARIATTAGLLRAMILDYRKKSNQEAEDENVYEGFVLDLLTALWRLETGVKVADANSEFGAFVIAMQAWIEAALESAECQGHESLAGEHMGETVYCDGTCR